MKDEWLPESYTDHELSAKIEERCPKALDVRDERLPKSDTDEDACAKNLDLMSQGHSHNEVWSTTLEGAVNWKGSRIVHFGLNLLCEYKKRHSPMTNVSSFLSEGRNLRIINESIYSELGLANGISFPLPTTFLKQPIKMS